MPAGYKLTAKEVQERITKIHGDLIRLDCSTYVNTTTKCRFIDKDYGEYYTTPASVLNKSVCHYRSLKITSEKLTMGIEEAKKRIKEIHGDAITLIEDTYTNTRTKCKVRDEKYGEYWIFPSNLFRGGVCRQRANEQIIINIEVIKDKIKEIHGDIITIVESSYKGIRTKCQFIDKEYGKYCAFPYHVLEGMTCWQRANLKRQKTNLEKYGVEFVTQNKVVKDKTTKTNLKKYGVKSPAQNADIMAKMKKTTMERYGVENALQNRDIALKVAKSSNNSLILHHWKTNEELVCVGSYEAGVVNRLNADHTEYLWQPQTFKMPPDENGKIKTYRPDLYLIEQDKWVEIKGYFRNDAQEKWDWFHSTHRNSELWNKTKLKEFGILYNERLELNNG